MHKASFGYQLSRADATALLRAYAQEACRVDALEVKLAQLRAEVESQRAANEALTNSRG